MTWKIHRITAFSRCAIEQPITGHPAGHIGNSHVETESIICPAAKDRVIKIPGIFAIDRYKRKCGQIDDSFRMLVAGFARNSTERFRNSFRPDGRDLVLGNDVLSDRQWIRVERRLWFLHATLVRHLQWVPVMPGAHRLSQLTSFLSMGKVRALDLATFFFRFFRNSCRSSFLPRWRNW